MLLAARGNLKEALELTQTWLEQEQNDGVALWTWAILYMAQENWLAAYPLFQLLQQQTSPVWQILGLCGAYVSGSSLPEKPLDAGTILRITQPLATTKNSYRLSSERGLLLHALALYSKNPIHWQAARAAYKDACTHNPGNRHAEACLARLDATKPSHSVSQSAGR
jgi:tetratricopeptide (TPR) repeat protein